MGNLCCVGISCLEANEYIVVTRPTNRSVYHGPGWELFCCGTAHRHDKITLTNTQYLRVTHLNGDETTMIEMIEGPCLYEPRDPYANISAVQNKVQLTNDHYIIVTDELTGQKSTFSGPMLYTPKAYDKCSAIQNKVQLTGTQYMIMTNELTGEMETICKAGLYCPDPFIKFGPVTDMVHLSNNQYIYITDTRSGAIDIAEGPRTFPLRPLDAASSIKNKIMLERDEYIKIADQNTGVIRVEKGPTAVILQPFERQMTDRKQKAPQINENTAVEVNNIATGSIELIQMEETPFMFFPDATHEIIRIQEKIRLQQHEVMVLIDKHGKYTYTRGTDDTRSFFIPPYTTILEQHWSVDLQKQRSETVPITRFDMRPQYLEYEFVIRTHDNVEIILRLNFNWQIIDIERTITKSNDIHQIICMHALSQILSETSRKEMSEFMTSFNEIIADSIEKGSSFYEERGVVIHSARIISRRCRDEATEETFTEIIKAKISRLQTVQTQLASNEVHLHKLDGDIAAKRKESELLQVERDYTRGSRALEGASEADHVANFLNHLPNELSWEQKLAIYFDMQNTTRVNSVTSSGASLYLTPQELDFKVTNLNFSDADTSRSKTKQAIKAIVNK